jgi:rhamnogalacturonan acetylesterase
MKPQFHRPFLLPVLLAVVHLSASAQTNATGAADSSARDRRNMPAPANPKIPSLFLIGDSTVRNGSGLGAGGQWGWGDCLAPFFDTNRINVVNRALGGTSSRTFYRDQWPGVLAMLKAGDFVMMQFGHNDSSAVNDAERARGTIKGVGDETQAIDNLLTKQHEIVHSFGWYEKQMVAEARKKGATPMICSLIPRNTWRNGQVARNMSDYGGWAGKVAASEKAHFLDINEIIARQYDALGQENVNALFVPGAGPHTSLAGAQTNATCVVSALKGLDNSPLVPFFSEKAASISPAVLTK